MNAMKPAFKKLTWSYTVTVCVFISFLLGVLAAFSVASYIGYELNDGILLLIGLALGTGSNIFYDCRELIKGLGNKLNEIRKPAE